MLARTFVDVADTLVADFDVVDYLTAADPAHGRAVRAVGGRPAPRGPGGHGQRRRVLESPNGAARALRDTRHEGPCLDCYHMRRARSLPRPDGGVRTMAELRARSRRTRVRLGVRPPDAVAISSHRLAEPAPRGARESSSQTISWRRRRWRTSATIGILQQRAASEQRLLAEQLQYALDSRVTIEQAKGVIAEHSRVDMDDAFAALRLYARNKNERLVDVAHAVAARVLPAADIAVELARPAQAPPRDRSAATPRPPRSVCLHAVNCM